MVGCPVAHRSWILEHWFDAIEESCAAAGVEPMYAFVVDRGDECLAIIDKRAPYYAVEETAPDKATDNRVWDPRRFGVMADLRNRLLGLVRAYAPDRFLSVDSDILVHPDLVRALLEDLAAGDYAAVGGKCFMTATGTMFPSWGRLGREGMLQRYEASSYFVVDVIMAIKMMTPAAYGVDYVTDVQGEDIGWSKACRAQGLRLGWDGRIASKHVLNRQMLHRRDNRVGW